MLCCDCVNTEDDYIDVFQGPKYEMEYQYSYFLSHLAVCLTFAPGMPILYPIAFLGTVFLYHLDKISLIYAYRKPIDVSETINNAGNSFIFGILILNILWASYTFSNNEFFCTTSTMCSNSTPRFNFNRLFAISSIFDI